MYALFSGNPPTKRVINLSRSVVREKKVSVIVYLATSGIVVAQKGEPFIRGFVAILFEVDLNRKVFWIDKSFLEGNSIKTV